MSSPVTLQDKYVLEDGTVFLTGIQALVRVMLDQARADRRAGLDTATFVSGYQGSPLAGLDHELHRLGDLAEEHRLRFTPGLNEELAATAVFGTQLAPAMHGARHDGVTGYWYGKAPGLDRATDAMRHANLAGTHPHGGAVALVGDDPAAKSSTFPSATEATLAALHVPTFFPGSLDEVLDLGRHAVACSRASGLWSAMKLVTNLADAAGTATVHPGRVTPVAPEVLWEGRPYVHTPRADLLGPTVLELERSLFGVRLEIARSYAALNGLNPVTVPTRDAWLGLVAAGRTYHELVQALRDLGLGTNDLERAGVRLLRIGMLYPNDRDGLRAFAAGLEEVLVVEEKGPFLESALRDALYGTTDAPRIVGKTDEQDRPLVPPAGELDADTIALAVAARLARRVPDAGVAGRVALVEARRAAIPARPAAPARTPSFCSGCPHSTSTVSPDGTVVGAGIGCHTMILLTPGGHGSVTGLTQMGGEGAQFAGITPFVDTGHVVQNVGDGTFHHSASLALRFAVAAGLDITYKLLYNDTVAMTGGQDVVGRLGIPELTRWLELEGVRRIIVTAEDPGRHRGAELSPIATVRHRDELAAAQAELAAVPGVTVLIHDQHCAAELRRMRKRGKVPAPAKRIHINERVCEGCGDCGRKSSCMSVVPVDTELGRKTQIHQSSCNQDFSCLKGDCPSFLEIVPAPAAGPRPIALPDAELPEPVLRVDADDVLVRMPGVGGTGVVTVSQVLQMAAMLDGLHASGLDQTGLSQKGGPVVSDVRLTRATPEGSPRASTAGADVLLGLDLLGAAHPRTLMVADAQRTIAVLNTHRMPTAAMITDTSVRLPALDRELAAVAAATRETVALDATALAEALFADHMPANTIMLGAAYQAGCLPVGADAIEQALRLNGAGVEQNLAAFAWGRAAIAAPEVVERVLAPPAPVPVLDVTAAAIVDATGAGGELRRLLEVRVPDLVAYQDARLARTYAAAVADVARVERERGAPGETAIAEAFARGLHKLLAYKDEYEVARLHLDAVEAARREAAFGADAQVRFLLHPPLLRAMGLERKIALGSWFVPAFRGLARARRLRGTPLDPFGRAEVRRVERALPGEYRALVDRALARLTPATHDQVARIAGLADVVRGYEDIKLEAVARFRAEAARLERELAAPVPFTLPMAPGR